MSTEAMMLVRDGSQVFVVVWFCQKECFRLPELRTLGTILRNKCKHQYEYVQVQVQCCFTSTETIRTIRDGEPRTATSSLTQLLSSDEYFGNEWAKINTFRPVTKQILVYIINFPQKPVRNRTVLSR